MKKLEIPVEIRVQGENQSNNVCTVEKIQFFIHRREEHGKILFYKVYLESELDLYFDYYITIDNANFSHILEENDIQMSIEQFGDALKTMLENL